MMDSFCVVRNQPLHKLAVKLRGIQEVISVIIDEFFLNCSVESFAMSVHFWGLWISVIMNKVKPFKFFWKMLFELRSVIGKDECKQIREN